MIVFYCKNSLLGNDDYRNEMRSKYNFECMELDCSGNIKAVEILRAFEKHERAVVVGCLEGNCRYRTGSKWARKRAEYANKLAREVGLDRSVIFINASRANEAKFEKAIAEIVSTKMHNIAKVIA